MNPFYQALDEGYSAEDVIGYISKAIPKMAKSINRAKSAGYTVQQILGYLSKTMNPNERRTMSESQIHARKRQEDSEMVKHGLLIGAGAVATPIAFQAARNAISRALPSQLKNLGQSGGNIPALGNAQQLGMSQPIQEQLQQTQSLANQTTSQQPPVNQVPPNIPQPQPLTQPEVISNPKEYLDKLGVTGEVDSLLKAGNTPEAVAATIGIKGVKGKLKGEIDPELLKNIEEYAKTTPQKEPEKPIEPVKIEKSSTVLAPQGVGEVKEIRNGKAIIDIDGNKHQVNEDELETPDFSQDEIADAYDNLFAKIPEKHRSGFIQWAGYDENRNVLGFIPRGGKYEELSEITPEEAQMIKEGRGTARTSGEVREGLWVAGEDTRGGVISQIIHDRRRKHEAGQKKQLEFDFGLPKPEKQDIGMKPIFDELEYPRTLSRERDKKKKLEERLKKKKERDEAKKRKK